MRLVLPLAASPESTIQQWGSELRTTDFVTRTENSNYSREIGPSVVGLGTIVASLAVQPSENWLELTASGARLRGEEYPDFCEACGFQVIPTGAGSVIVLPTPAAMGLPPLTGGKYYVKVK